MAKSYRFLRVSSTVFKVLAWLTLGLQSLAGITLLVTGGEPFLVGGVEMPARVVGLLNFVAAGVYFFLFWLIRSLIQLLLDLEARMPGGASK